MSDEQEFMELAIGNLEQDDDRTVPPSVLGSIRAERANERKAGSLKSTLTQYAVIGGIGFMPTSDTKKALPPDCYTVTYTPNGDIVFLAQQIITDNLLRLPDSKSDEVLEEIEKFWGLKNKFTKFGFAHKRGFLLFGPPGSGKTSTIAITIADMIKRGGLAIIGSNPELLSKGLAQMRTIEPDRPVVVILEDIDTIIQNYGESTVLSLLDGEAQIENVVYLATTNYPEKLDGRVTNRPSRFDKVVKIGLPNVQARKMFLESKLGSSVLEGIDVAEATDGLSIAHIKEFIVATQCQGNSVKSTLERLKKMKVMPKSDGESNPIGFGLGK